jgi:3-oxoadipate enol-lactonase
MSLGFPWAAWFALSLARARNDLIRKVVVANSFASTATPEFRKLAHGLAAKFRCEDGPSRILEEIRPMLVNESFRRFDEGRRTWQVWHGIAAMTDGASLAYILEGVAGGDLSSQLGSLRVETMFIAGDQDGIAPPDVVRRMAGMVEGARYTQTYRGRAYFQRGFGGWLQSRGGAISRGA